MRVVGFVDVDGGRALAGERLELEARPSSRKMRRTSSREIADFERQDDGLDAGAHAGIIAQAGMTRASR